MIKMVILCVIAFALTWLPFNALILMGDMFPDIWEHQNIMHIWFLTHYLAMCHTITNPLIYIYMNNRFRAGFKQVLGNLICVRMCSTFFGKKGCCLACLSFPCSRHKLFARTLRNHQTAHLAGTNSPNNPESNIDNLNSSNNNNNNRNDGTGGTSNINRNNKIIHGPPGAGSSSSTGNAKGACDGQAGSSSTFTGSLPAPTTCSATETTTTRSAGLPTSGIASASGSSRTASARTSSSISSATTFSNTFNHQVRPTCRTNSQSTAGFGARKAVDYAREDLELRDMKRKRRKKGQSHAINIQMVSKEFPSTLAEGSLRATGANGVQPPVKAARCKGRKSMLEFDLHQWSQSTATISMLTNLTSLDQPSDAIPCDGATPISQTDPEGGGAKQVSGPHSLSWPAQSAGSADGGTHKRVSSVPDEVVVVDAVKTEGLTEGCARDTPSRRSVGAAELGHRVRERKKSQQRATLRGARQQRGPARVSEPKDGRGSGTDEDICAQDAFRSRSQSVVSHPDSYSHSPLSKSLAALEQSGPSPMSHLEQVNPEQQQAKARITASRRLRRKQMRESNESLELVSSDEEDEEEEENDLDECSKFIERLQNGKGADDEDASSSSTSPSGSDNDDDDDDDESEYDARGDLEKPVLELMPLKDTTHSGRSSKERQGDALKQVKVPLTGSRLHLLRRLFRSTGTELCIEDPLTVEENEEALKEELKRDTEEYESDEFLRATCEEEKKKRTKTGLSTGRQLAKLREFHHAAPENSSKVSSKERSLRKTMLLHNHVLSSLSKLPNLSQQKNGQLEGQLQVVVRPSSRPAVLFPRQVASSLPSNSSTHQSSSHSPPDEQDGANEATT